MKNLIILISIVILGMLASCKVTKPTPPPTMRACRFDYVPPRDSTRTAQSINIALVHPTFVKTFKGADRVPYSTFVKSMESDFIEMLTARGYNYLGPFHTYDEMVYSDKKTADLVLDIEVDLNFTGDFLKTYSYTDYTTKQIKYQYYYDGIAYMNGKVNLVISEPFTKTRVWVKSVPISGVSFYIKSFYRYTGKAIPETDVTVWNTLTENMEKAYQQALQTCWKHLDPEELKIKKAEADEIKKNSGFIKN